MWQRLEDSFGAPKIIENALFKKVENFPKIENRETQQLRELGDLLLELQAAKLNDYLPGLSHLDTAHGVNLILAKLSYNLQEKWVSAASKFKRDNSVLPPIWIFCKYYK